MRELPSESIVDPPTRIIVDLSDWSGTGERHLELGPNDEIPLVEGQFLGRGTFGDVHKATCKSGKLTVARKKVYLRRRMRMKELYREVEILEKLDHEHIVKFVGSYTQAKVLGLIMWPAAVCDLGYFLDELDSFDREAAVDGPWAALRLSINDTDGGGRRPLEALKFLRAQYGCIANTLRYLHKRSIRHRDLKPANILLTSEKAYLTDFGVGLDFSELSKSYTEGPLNGTPRYYSPEMASYQPRGPKSDVYSLGCIFLEMETILQGRSLAEFERHRTVDGNGSYSHNSAQVQSWIDGLTLDGIDLGWDRDVLPLIQGMLKRDPSNRPNANQVCMELYSRGGHPSSHHMPCCRNERFTTSVTEETRGSIVTLATHVIDVPLAEDLSQRTSVQAPNLTVHIAMWGERDITASVRWNIKPNQTLEIDTTHDMETGDPWFGVRKVTCIIYSYAGQPLSLLVTYDSAGIFSIYPGRVEPLSLLAPSSDGGSNSKAVGAGLEILAVIWGAMLGKHEPVDKETMDKIYKGSIVECTNDFFGFDGFPSQGKTCQVFYRIDSGAIRCKVGREHSTIILDQLE
ncbi:MAG: hypothetical protein M1833_002219 [Piccolia ochrophora]|nr:MAG: hypothetical protein M1833_002219 [Piccolia ochrophora]